MKKIVIIGGGPAGSLSAIMLLRKARQAGLDLDVLILESKPFGKPGAKGCNYCAGVVTGRTLQRLGELGIVVSRKIIQRRIDSFHYVTEGGSLCFGMKNRSRIYSVFRGGGPKNVFEDLEESFDEFLLKHALTSGASFEKALVKGVRRKSDGSICVTTTEEKTVSGDFVVGAFGVNSSLANSLHQSLGYSPPKSAAIAQAEIPMPREMIKELYGKRIVSFCLKHPKIRFLAITPKKKYLTLTAVGSAITIADLRNYIKHPKVQHFIPLDESEYLKGCHCMPRMPVGIARGAVSGNFAAVGDAFASRYYKNGLGSALFSASALSDSLIDSFLNGSELGNDYRKKIRKRFHMGNIAGKIMFALNDIAYKNRLIAEANFALIRKEREKEGSGPMNRLMWSLFTGDQSYTRLLRRALNPVLAVRMIYWIVKYIFKGMYKWITAKTWGP